MPCSVQLLVARNVCLIMAFCCLFGGILLFVRFSPLPRASVNRQPIEAFTITRSAPGEGILSAATIHALLAEPPCTLKNSAPSLTRGTLSSSHPSFSRLPRTARDARGSDLHADVGGKRPRAPPQATVNLPGFSYSVPLKATTF